MSRAYGELVAKCEAEGIEPPSPSEFTRIWCGFDPISGEPTTGALQSAKDECDINRIVQAFDRDGVFTHLSQRVPEFLDVSEVPDFRTALDQVRSMDKFFRTLPAKVREAFDNDPARLLDALGDPGQRERLEELELLEKPKAAEPAPVA